MFSLKNHFTGKVKEENTFNSSPVMGGYLNSNYVLKSKHIVLKSPFLRRVAITAHLIFVIPIEEDGFGGGGGGGGGVLEWQDKWV